MNNIWLTEEFTSRYSTAEGITGPPASVLIKQAGLEGYSGSEELNIIDHACGTGIVSELLWNALGEEGRKNATLTCGDISEGMLSQMKERLVKVGWGDNGKAIVADLKNSGLPSDHFTHIIINMGVQALSNTEEALADCLRTLKPGGTLAFTTWHDLGWLGPVREALAKTNSPACPANAEEFFAKMGSTAPWHDAEFVKSKVQALPNADISSVQVTVAKTPAYASSGAEWAKATAGFVGMVAPMLWGKEDAEKWKSDEGKSAAFREELTKWAEGVSGSGTFEHWMVAVMTTVKKSTQ